MAAVKASRLLYDQAVVYEKRSVGSSEASPDDMDSKTNEIKEMAQVERILSDELSKVDANDKILVPTIHELTSQSNESVTASNNSGEGVPGKNVRFVATDNAGAKNLPNVKFSSSSPDQTPDQAQQDDPPDGANNAEKEGKEDKNESKV